MKCLRNNDKSILGLMISWLNKSFLIINTEIFAPLYQHKLTPSKLSLPLPTPWTFPCSPSGSLGEGEGGYSGGYSPPPPPLLIPHPVRNRTKFTTPAINNPSPAWKSPNLMGAYKYRGSGWIRTPQHAVGFVLRLRSPAATSAGN